MFWEFASEIKAVCANSDLLTFKMSKIEDDENSIILLVCGHAWGQKSEAKISSLTK